MSGRDATSSGGAFPQLPAALRERMITTRIDGPFGPIPALIAHPEPGWEQDGTTARPAPLCLWLHGRTANKELDPGRYLRWVRAGIGACAIDLAGHGERLGDDTTSPEATLPVIKQTLAEIDAVVGGLKSGIFSRVFDSARLAIGGMSLGGMATLRRLCDPHPFVCACVEATTGSFEGMRGRAFYHETLAKEAEAERHVDRWPRPVPLLALHSEKDEWVPLSSQNGFLNRLRARYTALGADPALIQLKTWPETGAPYEHIGFGRVSNDAKNLQTEFLVRYLNPM